MAPIYRRPAEPSTESFAGLDRDVTCDHPQEDVAHGAAASLRGVGGSPPRETSRSPSPSVFEELAMRHRSCSKPLWRSSR